MMVSDLPSDEDIDALESTDEEEEAIDELVPLVPPLRSKTYPATHRQQPKATEKASGTSWWLNKSREELNTEATQRVPEMRNSKEAMKVKGTTRES